MAGEDEALVAALESQAVHFPELAFTAASRVRRADRRDRILRLAFLAAASLQRDTAVRHLYRVIDRPWIAEVPFADAVEVALIAAAVSPDEARSTKRAIVAAGEVGIQDGVFLGGHPMAGKELTGVQNSDATLFENSTWFLTPRHREMLDRAPASEFVEWIVRIGAAPVPIAADQHDELVAFTSHLPQLLSTTLAALIQETIGLTKARVAAGRGLRDMTRLAESDYRIWKDIIATNPDRIVDALDAYLRRLNALRDEIQSVPLSRAAASPDVAREFGVAHDFSKPLRKANT